MKSHHIDLVPAALLESEPKHSVSTSIFSEGLCPAEAVVDGTRAKLNFLVATVALHVC